MLYVLFTHLLFLLAENLILSFQKEIFCNYQFQIAFFQFSSVEFINSILFIKRFEAILLKLIANFIFVILNLQQFFSNYPLYFLIIYSFQVI